MKMYSINELKSSNIMYDKNPPALLYWILGVLFMAFAFLITLACFTNKDEVISAQGILTSNNKVIIMPKMQGEVVNVYKQSGEYVEKGDLLYELNDIQVVSQIVANESKCELLKDYVESYDKIINWLLSIDFEEQLENPFASGLFYQECNSIINTLNNQLTVEAKENNRDGLVGQYESSKFQYYYEYLSVSSQIEAYKKMSDEYKAYAAESGIITYNVNLKPGCVVGSDSLGSISERINDENAIVEVYLPVSSRYYVKEGMSVSMAVSGLPQSTYGKLKGVVFSVASDSIYSEGQYYFKVVIKPNSIVLTKKNMSIDLSNGMVLETQFVYESSTWIKWALKKIGIIDR